MYLQSDSMRVFALEYVHTAAYINAYIDNIVVYACLCRSISMHTSFIRAFVRYHYSSHRQVGHPTICSTTQSAVIHPFINSSIHSFIHSFIHSVSNSNHELLRFLHTPPLCCRISYSAVGTAVEVPGSVPNLF